MIFYIYILYSSKSDKYYIGYTHNVLERLKDHNTGNRPEQSKKYTFKHRPWTLKAQFPVANNRADAMKVEKLIKKQKSRDFIKKLIEFQDKPDVLAQLMRVPILGINQ